MGVLPVHLELDAVLEIVENAAVHIKTDEPAVEAGTAVGAFLVTVLVTADDIAAELRHAGETGLLVAVCRLFIFLCGRRKACKEQERRGKGEDSFHKRIRFMR